MSHSSRDKLSVIEVLRETTCDSGVNYRLVRFQSMKFGITRDGLPILETDRRDDAEENFLLLTGAMPRRSRLRRKRR